MFTMLFNSLLFFIFGKISNLPSLEIIITKKYYANT
jgi:hypothetical protein